MDEVFKALADHSRRALLDALERRNGQTLRELCAGLDMARQSVSKHLAVLEEAGLITSMRRGREKLHYLDAGPIAAIADRWIDRYHRGRVAALADLKHALEEPMSGSPVFVYTTYIAAPAERVWAALTTPEFTRQYWGGVALHSEWKAGSPVLWQDAPDQPLIDRGDVVLESEPPWRLSYTWHSFQPEHQAYFGWSDEEFAQRAKEPRSKVTFVIAEAPGAVKLTLVHDGFDEDSQMHAAISGNLDGSGGWPELLSSLKTLLETGQPLPAAA